MAVAEILSVITRYLPSQDTTRLFLIGNRTLTYQLERGGITEVNHFVRDEWSHPHLHGDIFPVFLLSRLNSALNSDLSRDYLERFTLRRVPFVQQRLPQPPLDLPSLDPRHHLPYLHEGQEFRTFPIRHLAYEKERMQALNLPISTASACQSLEIYFSRMWQLLPRTNLTHLEIRAPTIGDHSEAFLILPLIYEHVQRPQLRRHFELSPTLNAPSMVPKTARPVLPFPKLIYAHLEPSCNFESIAFSEGVVSNLVAASTLTHFIGPTVPFGTSMMMEDMPSPLDDYLVRATGSSQTAETDLPSEPTSPFTLISKKSPRTIFAQQEGSRQPEPYDAQPFQELPKQGVPSAWSQLSSLKLRVSNLTAATLRALPSTLTALWVSSWTIDDECFTAPDAGPHPGSWPPFLTSLHVKTGHRSRFAPFTSDTTWNLALPPKLKSLRVSTGPFDNQVVSLISLGSLPPTLQCIWFSGIQLKLRQDLTPAFGPGVQLNGAGSPSHPLSRLLSFVCRDISGSNLASLSSVEWLTTSVIHDSKPHHYLPLVNLRYLSVETLEEENFIALETLPQLENLRIATFDYSFGILPRALRSLKVQLHSAAKDVHLLPPRLTDLHLDMLDLAGPLASETFGSLPRSLKTLLVNDAHIQSWKHVYEGLPASLTILKLDTGYYGQKPPLGFHRRSFWTLPSGQLRKLSQCFIAHAIGEDDWHSDGTPFLEDRSKM